MKKVKFAFWLIILALFGLLVYQNQSYFLTKHSLEINLYFTSGRTLPFHNLVIIVAFFGFGLLIAYTSSLFERFRANKTIKKLRADAQSLQGTIDQMRADVEALKAHPLSDTNAGALEEPADTSSQSEAEETPQA
jgi:Ni/Fe-hydrogenase subunit HybB-like protein